MTHPAMRIALYGALFFVVTSATIFWTRFAGGLALVWVGSALAAALFLTLPRVHHLGAFAILMGLSTAATALFGFGPAWALPLAVANIFEGWFIAWLLVRLRPQRDFIESEGGVASLGFWAGFVGPLPSAIVGGLMAVQIVGGTWLFHAFSWWVGHGLGTLLVLPLALLLQSYRREDFANMRDRARVLAFAGVVSLTALVSGFAFHQSAMPLLFLPIVPLVFASFRFRRFGAAIAVLVISVAAAFSLGMGTGVFAELAMPLWQKALFLQFYLATLLLIAFPMAVIIQQRQRILDELGDREAMQRLIADHSDDALLHLDSSGTIRFASPASTRLSGRGSVDQLHLAAFFSEFDRKKVDRALDKASRHPGRTEILERSVGRGGKTRWLEAKLRAVETSGRKVCGFVVTIRDITARKLEELEMTREARTDTLTGLPNRRAFLDILERRLDVADQEPFGLAFVDLDHFKQVNDTHGHAIGDKVLSEVGAIMNGMASDTYFFARLGGEEFAIIVKRPLAEAAADICERLRLAIEKHPMADSDGKAFTVTASLGFAMISESCSASMALQAADAPLYLAKASGRNRTCRAQGYGRLTRGGAPIEQARIAVAG